MYRRLTLLVLVSLCLAAGTSRPPYDKEKVLTALSKLSERTIAKHLTQCDLNGSTTQKDGTMVYNSVRVRDMFVKHVLWSQMESDVKSQGFDCEEESGQSKNKSKGMLSCRWWFGEKEGTPKSPGWSISMVFSYDQKKGEVRPADIMCVKVP